MGTATAFLQITSDADATGVRTTGKAYHPYCIRRRLGPRVGQTLA